MEALSARSLAVALSDSSSVGMGGISCCVSLRGGAVSSGRRGSE